jgi:hypothetical protein
MANGSVAAALTRWRDLSPPTAREELATICERSISTVDRWVRGVGEPTYSDIWLMESHKPGLVRLLFPSVIKRERHVAGRVARAG